MQRQKVVRLVKISIVTRTLAQLKHKTATRLCRPSLPSLLERSILQSRENYFGKTQKKFSSPSSVRARAKSWIRFFSRTSLVLSPLLVLTQLTLPAAPTNQTVRTNFIHCSLPFWEELWPRLHLDIILNGSTMPQWRCSRRRATG